MSRLVYRKGMNLLAAIIPAICADHDNVDFLIGMKLVLLATLLGNQCYIVRWGWTEKNSSRRSQRETSTAWSSQTPRAS